MPFTLPKKLYNIQFNGALPITIIVLESVGFRRYRLKVGNKELSTKSLTKLHVGHQYWGDFSYTKDGMLSIGNLKEKPAILQKETNFLKLNSWDLVEELSLHGEPYFKEWLLNSLETTQSQVDFKILSSMLLALHEGIIHLPLMVNFRPFLLQYKSIKNELLNQNLIDFFFAFDTLGAIKGTLKSENEINLETLFNKTAVLIKDNNLENKTLHVSVAQKLLPLWKGEDGLLDVKG